MIAYLVPTRALIHQVEEDLFTSLTHSEKEIINVTSIPLKKSLASGKSNILIFTQERFHIFMNAFEKSLEVDILIIDEAYKLGDSQRGVLLQQVIENVVSTNPKSKVIFISPLAEQPETLLQDLPIPIIKFRNGFQEASLCSTLNYFWHTPERWTQDRTVFVRSSTEISSKFKIF